MSQEAKSPVLSWANAGRLALSIAVIAVAVSSGWLDPHVHSLVQRITTHYPALSQHLLPVLGNASADPFLDGFVCKHEYSVEVIRRSPLVVRINNFLQPGEAEHIIKVSTPRLIKSTVVRDKDDHYILNDSVRTSSTAWLDKYQDPVVRCIEERAARFAPVNPVHCESLQVLRYGPGQKYSMHYDYFPRDMLQDEFWGQYGQRYSTVLVYLNDVEEGGHTDFPRLGLSVKPVKDSAVFWYNVDLDDVEDPLTLHGGMPVTKGLKWAINISQRRWIPSLAPWHGWRKEKLKEGEEDSLDMYNIPAFAKPYITSVTSEKLEPYWEDLLHEQDKTDKTVVADTQDAGHASPPIPNA